MWLLFDQSIIIFAYRFPDCEDYSFKGMYLHIPLVVLPTCVSFTLYYSVYYTGGKINRDIF